MTSPVSPSETIAKAMEGVTPFHVSRSSDGKNEWYSCRDAATGISIPCDSRDRAVALVSSLNDTFAHHFTVALRETALQLEAMQREMAEKDERIAALEAGMKPFAKQEAHPSWDNGMRISNISPSRLSITVGDLRRARTLIQGEKK